MMPPNDLTAQFRKELETGETQPIDGCHPNCDCERFVELWNLVFMQFYQDTNGGRTPLPAPSVDTGMGLERAMVILQGKNNIYETDLFVPIIDRVGQLTGKTYGKDTDTDYAMRVVVEHARAAAFLIGDGVVPGNEGRGYVLRRVIRRAIRYGRQLGLEEAFLTDVVEAVIPQFSTVYKELSENHEFIQRVIRLEEERFSEAIQTGLPLLEDGFIPIRKLLLNDSNLGNLDVASIDAALLLEEITNAATHGTLEIVGEALKAGLPAGLEKQRKFIGTLSDAETFVLYDTYGFPSELTAEIAKEHGLEVDMEGFEREMDAQKEQSRSSGSFSGAMEMQTTYSDLGLGASEFVGYNLIEQDSKIAAILSGGISVDHATQGQQVEIVISQSPFYAEGGGQLGDRGVISGPNGVVTVEDTQSPVAGLIVQRGTVDQGEISVGEAVTASVEAARRLDSSRNHSGTHILHAALRSVLGVHVRQAGSFVAPERLRFDFSHVSALTRDELLSVQSLANDQVRGNLTVTSHETSYSEAVREGALAFFGDRYGDVVRVVTMAPEPHSPGSHLTEDAFSVEVCGGTHVSATGQVGTLVVLGESSIGGGMRRIEAVTGRAAEELFVQQSDRLETLSQKLQTPVADLEARLDTFMQENDDLRKQLEGFQKTSLRGEAEELLGQVQDVDGVKVVAGRTSAGSADGMREMGDFLKDKLGSVVVALAAVVEGSPILITMVTPDLVERGLHAGNIARDTAKVMGGGGGGRPEMAQAGGKQPEKVDEALSGVPALVRQGLS
jgi:alanyl-tRNA synthetase